MQTPRWRLLILTHAHTYIELSVVSWGIFLLHILCIWNCRFVTSQMGKTRFITFSETIGSYSTSNLMVIIAFAWLGSTQCSSRYNTTPSLSSIVLHLHLLQLPIPVLEAVVGVVAWHCPDVTNSSGTDTMQLGIRLQLVLLVYRAWPHLSASG